MPSLGLGHSIPNSPLIASAATTYPLDDYTGSAAAYATVRLYTDHSTALLRVYRVSDAEEADVHPDSNGEVSLDSTVDNFSTSSLAANLGEFVAAAGYTDADSLGAADTARVADWYDQSGNARTASQATAANMPTLVNAGTLVTENSVATLDFDGANDAFITSATGIISGTSSRSSFAVVEADVDNSLDYLYSLSDSGASGSQWLATTEPGVRCNNQIRIWDGDNITTPLRMHTITFPAAGNAADIDLWVDGTLATETSLTDGGIDTSTAQPLKVGGNSANGRVLDGRMSCLVLYASDETANRAGIESALAAEYGITLS